ncbi:hypothetical protein ACRRTK_019158 [Alexandromys fortis]
MAFSSDLWSPLMVAPYLEDKTEHSSDRDRRNMACALLGSSRVFWAGGSDSG